MPRDRSLTLSDVREPTLAIACERLSHRRDGADAKLTDLLATLANCENARSPSIHDRCKAMFEGFSFS
jgi:hypothetical protein